MTTTTAARKFIPEDHLRCLKCGKPVSVCGCGAYQRPYLETKWRLVWLREKYPPDAISLDTEIVAWEPAIVVKATATFPIGSRDVETHVTAFGSATPEKGKVYSGREVEKAETAALGRLCAMLGFGTQFTEEDDTDHLADSPGEAKLGRAGTQGVQGSAPRPVEPANPASKPQKDSIARMLHQLPEADAEEFCQEYDITIESRTDGRHYGKGIAAAGLTGGTHGTASQLIDALLPLVKHEAKGVPSGGVEMADPRVPEPVAADFLEVDIKTAGDLFTYCWKEWQMQRGEVFKLLGVKKVAEIVNPAAALKIVLHAKAVLVEPEQAALMEEE